MRHRATAAILAGLLAAALTTPPALARPAGSGESQFGRMFGAEVSNATAQELADLAQTQLDPNNITDNNPTGLTSAFTYFGQFVDHDLTLDLSPSPTATVDPATLVNQRTLTFDLDSVYGGGPDVSPQLYQADRTRLLVNPNRFDLPRNPDGSAVLVERRNDENQILAQIHAAFLAFHNTQVDAGLGFDQARAVTVAAYRHIVRTEFLPHIVSAATLATVTDDLKKGKQGFYDPGKRKEPMTPVEFSVAAYRFGHSQVRLAYRLNGNGNCANLQVFSLTDPAASLMGGRPIPETRRISWGMFLDDLPQPEGCAGVQPRNISRKIDPLLSASLFRLPIPGAEAAGSNVLGFRNLIRAKFYDMPTGQTVARAMGATPLTVPQAGPLFADATPLWYYILAEASADNDGATLGPVGGRIVAEVFVDVLAKFTFAPPAGQPATFGLSDLLVTAGIASRELP